MFPFEGVDLIHYKPGTFKNCVMKYCCIKKKSLVGDEKNYHTQQKVSKSTAH